MTSFSIRSSNVLPSSSKASSPGCQTTVVVSQVSAHNSLFVGGRYVLGVGSGRVCGVAFDRCGGVAEGLSDDGHGREFGEFVKGSESRGPGAEELAEARCEVSGVDVSSGRGSPEYLGGVGV
jgi:hypothetical protein